MSVYPDYIELRKGVSPAPSVHEQSILVYADEQGVIHTLQSNGVDWKAGTGPPGQQLENAVVGALEPPWQPSNASVAMTPDGVVFGPYLDGAAAGGSLRYHGLDGQPMSVVKNLAFRMSYLDDDKQNDPSPYLRIFVEDSDGNPHDAAFTPGSQDYPGLGEGPTQEFVATAGMWRYDSDDGSNSEFGNGVPLTEIVAKYGDQPITKINITLGYTAGVNLTGLLRWWQINGTNYSFLGAA